MDRKKPCGQAAGWGSLNACVSRKKQQRREQKRVQACKYGHRVSRRAAAGQAFRGRAGPASLRRARLSPGHPQPCVRLLPPRRQKDAALPRAGLRLPLMRALAVWAWANAAPAWHASLARSMDPQTLARPASALVLAEQDAAVVAAKAEAVGQGHAGRVPLLLLLAHHHPQVHRLLGVVQVQVGVQVACGEARGKPGWGGQVTESWMECFGRSGGALVGWGWRFGGRWGGPGWVQVGWL